MPKEHDTMRVAAHKARAVNHIGKTGANRFKHGVIFGRVIFQIGILDNEVFAGSIGYASMQGGAFTFIYLVFKILDIDVWISLPVSYNGALGMVD